MPVKFHKALKEKGYQKQNKQTNKRKRKNKWVVPGSSYDYFCIVWITFASSFFYFSIYDAASFKNCTKRKHVIFPKYNVGALVFSEILKKVSECLFQTEYS